jgi:hypothetical protein
MKELPFDPYDFFGYIASGLVLIVVAQLTLGFPMVFGADLKPFDMAVTVLAVYIAGQIVAGPSKALLEDLLTQRVLGSPTKNLLSDTRPRLLRFIFPGYYTPLPKSIRSKIAAKIDALQLINTDTEGIFLSIRFAPDVLASDTLIARLSTFRDQYGFNRNVSFSLLFAAMCFVIAAHVKSNDLLDHYSIAAFVAGTLLFYRYLKFYRQYSYELFNTYARMSEKGTG